MVCVCVCTAADTTTNTKLLSTTTDATTTDLQFARHHDNITLNGIVSVAVGEHQSHVLSELTRRPILASVKLTLHTKSHPF